MSDDGTVYLLRWPREDDGRLTAKFHVVANPEAADYEATIFTAPDVELACGLAVSMLTAADARSEVKTLYPGSGWAFLDRVCRVCAHETGLRDKIAADFLHRFTRWEAFRPSSVGYIKGTVA